MKGQGSKIKERERRAVFNPQALEPSYLGSDISVSTSLLYLSRHNHFHRSKQPTAKKLALSNDLA